MPETAQSIYNKNKQALSLNGKAPDGLLYNSLLMSGTSFYP